MGGARTKALVLALAAVVLLALPAIALGDPGHAAGSPHLNLPNSQPTGGSSNADSGSLLIVATLATLVIFAGCAVALKYAQGRREE